MRWFLSFVGGLILAGGVMWGYLNKDKLGVLSLMSGQSDALSVQNVDVDSTIAYAKATSIKKNIGWLAKYNFENLKKRGGIESEIKTLGQVLVVEEARKETLKKYAEEGIIKQNNFESRAIQFESNGKKISGMMNVPLTPSSKKMPTIIMIRGYAESEGYFIGSGSWKMADELARNGFITISLDFLGYGLSDGESFDILEARFEKPMSVLDLIQSVKQLDIVDNSKIGIWSHSNGGQIAMTVLEVTGEKYPTVMWAPMTKPFPESIVSTMDESEAGKVVKAKVADFEKEYDSRLYSIDNYYDWVRAPILIHQGTEDVWCKVEWQKTLQKKLQDLGQEVTVDVQQGCDHNMKQNWDEVAAKDVKFFKQKFGL